MAVKLVEGLMERNTSRVYLWDRVLQKFGKGKSDAARGFTYRHPSDQTSPQNVFLFHYEEVTAKRCGFQYCFLLAEVLHVVRLENAERHRGPLSNRSTKCWESPSENFHTSKFPLYYHY